MAVRRFLGTWCVLFLILAAGRAASAEDGIAIAGTITTRADGLSVPGAEVSIVGADVTVTSDASGRYRIEAPRAAAQGDRLQLKWRRSACRRSSWTSSSTGRR
jgi:hypothetical protein